MSVEWKRKIESANKKGRYNVRIKMAGNRKWRRIACGPAIIFVAATAFFFALVPANAQEPIKIGFGMALTGGLAQNGKSALLAMKIWEEDVNAKGGLLGRKVKLIYYDDQSSPSAVPGIYTKLLDIDKVDLIVSGYASGQIAPLMPIAIQRKRLLIGLFGTGVNDEFNYYRYFSMIPNGPTPKLAITRGFFKVAEAQKPKPQTIAIASAAAEFGINACEGARENAKTAGFKIVYDKTYPPATTEFSPIVRAIQATNPDLVVLCSYPLDTVGMVRAIHEIGFKPKMWGGAMVGLQATAFKIQLGPLLNGIVNYDLWLPAKPIQFPGSMDLLKKYQDRAKAEGIDPLGYYMPVWAYAYLQVLEQAVQETKSLNDDKLANYIHNATFKTVVGDVRFGPNGEWEHERTLTIQFQNIKGNTIDDFRDVSVEPILYPPQYSSGNVIYPYANAVK
jgi:branched-chain amino acid transport system substrate-binding protein